MSERRLWPLAAAVAMLASLALPVASIDGAAIYWLERPLLTVAVLIGAAAALALVSRRGTRLGLIGSAGAVIGATAPLTLTGSGAGMWLYLLGLVALAWQSLERLAAVRAPGWVGGILVPGLFGALVLFLWQVFVDALAISPVLLPSPLRIGQALGANLGVLWQDFRQTFLKSVLAGFALG